LLTFLYLDVALSVLLEQDQMALYVIQLARRSGVCFWGAPLADAGRAVARSGGPPSFKEWLVENIKHRPYMSYNFLEYLAQKLQTLKLDAAYRQLCTHCRERGIPLPAYTLPIDSGNEQMDPIVPEDILADIRRDRLGFLQRIHIAVRQAMKARSISSTHNLLSYFRQSIVLISIASCV
jgi:hypothetical protein